MAGKGSRRRQYDAKKFNGNYDQINWSKKTKQKKNEKTVVSMGKNS